MTPTNRDELVALMARADLVTKFPDYADDAKWYAHWQWYLDGRVNPNSCVHYSNQALAVARVSAVIDAMIKAGLAVVPVEVTDAIVAATDPAKSIAENWRLRVAAGRIDGGAA